MNNSLKKKIEAGGGGGGSLYCLHPSCILGRQHQGVSPTSAWDDQFAGQSQWDDGVLIDQGGQGTCGEKQRTRLGD